MIIPDSLLQKCDTLFLDRDGVVNVWLPGDYVKNWQEFRFNPGFPDFIGRYSSSFRHIFIVTNQRGVGKGLSPPICRLLSCRVSFHFSFTVSKV